jgi:EAL domain-containing protein (putative c-di-GMP-specific phosphodiesterase class I)
MAVLIRFFAQPKYSITSVKLIGYELFIRERETRDSDWFLPDDFSRFTPADISELLSDTLKTFPQGLNSVSFNLDQEQFVDLAYCQTLAILQQQTPIKLHIELTERPGVGKKLLTHAEIVQAAQAYQQAGLHVCVDDVGTGTNQYELVNELAPYAVEYKFALQNVRGALPPTEIKEQVGFWREMALRQHKLFALEGFEVSRDMELIHTFQPDIVQGYYFGRPRMLPTAKDFC